MLSDIKGLGPKGMMALNNLNIYTINDLISYYPYRYNIYKPVRIKDADLNNEIVVTGKIESLPKIFFIKKNLNKITFRFNTNYELINVSIFNRAYLKGNLTINKEITIIGKYNSKSNSFMASDIKLFPIKKTSIEPVYHLNSGIKRAIFKKVLDNSLEKNSNFINYIPDYLIKRYNFIDKKIAIKEIHNPTSVDVLKQSKLMLIYEEFFVFMLKIEALKDYHKKNNVEFKKNYDYQKVDAFIKRLPFELTLDQIKAINDIKNDFESNNVMNRLLLGDVGSGKTIVAFIALYMNYLSGYSGILMAPTEILANQHYDNMISLFKNLNINIRLITSKTSIKDKKIIINDINYNKVDVLIGTHAVLNEKLVFNNLGLVITDEQHRFGVNQRNILREKGKCTDVLYMSATPIPRTLALTIYGDMDITEIKTKPKNRKDIKTSVYTMSDIKIVLNEILEHIKNNHQVYIVAPLIEASNDESVNQNVVELKDKIDLAFNKKIPIDILHGKLKNNVKEEVMNNFKNGKTKILISTTVIEVGVDVSNATLMVIFNAERFGLATLHQLRGRIGRNEYESSCLLISDKDTPRLKVLCESNDGFYISEKDFELRGSGDIFGVKQSGDMVFKLGDLTTDFKVLKKCKEDVLEFMDVYKENSDNFMIQKELINNLHIK